MHLFSRDVLNIKDITTGPNLRQTKATLTNTLPHISTSSGDTEEGTEQTIIYFTKEQMFECFPSTLFLKVYLPLCSMSVCTSEPDPPCPPPYPYTPEALAPTDLEEHMLYF